MQYILETKNLTKKYRDFKVLNNLNIHVEKSAIYGLIGRNGAGKTTLIRIICGLIKPTFGSYSLYNENSTTSNILNSQKRIGALIESPSLYNNLTAKDNLIIQSQILGNPSLDNIDNLLELVGLKNTKEKKVKNFSLGMKGRLGIALALVGHPDFLLLDEPINGLEPEGIIEIRELILRLNKNYQITVLLSSHYLDELSKIATHYGFIDHGTIIKEISNKELSTKISHKITLKVTKPETYIPYLEDNKLSYEVLDNNNINVYTKISLPKLLNELGKHNLTPEDIHETEETLESYYLNLIGGENHD